MSDIIEEAMKRFSHLKEAMETLPGHAREIIPLIKTLEPTVEEFTLLFEMSKSSATRQMIGNLQRDAGVVAQVLAASNDEAMPIGTRKRLNDAIERWRVNYPTA